MPSPSRGTETEILIKDLGQIATLILTGYKPTRFLHEGRVMKVSFPLTPEIEKAIRAYVLDDLRVPPRALLSLLRDLKAIAEQP